MFVLDVNIYFIATHSFISQSFIPLESLAKLFCGFHHLLQIEKKKILPLEYKCCVWDTGFYQVGKSVVL